MQNEFLKIKWNMFLSSHHMKWLINKSKFYDESLKYPKKRNDWWSLWNHIDLFLMSLYWCKLKIYDLEFKKWDKRLYLISSWLISCSEKDFIRTTQLWWSHQLSNMRRKIDLFNQRLSIGVNHKSRWRHQNHLKRKFIKNKRMNLKNPRSSKWWKNLTTEQKNKSNLQLDS